MIDIEKFILPNREGFDSDPFGYSALARQKWGMAKTMSGFTVDIVKPATTEDLKDPTLWLTQAQALSQAAVIVLRNNPDLNHMPILIRSVCDSQYCATGLMLVGYSLEIILKAMMILKNGINYFIENEKLYKHHRLQDLADFVPNLSAKDKIILKLLTHFVRWAGRYPDPGTNKLNDAEEIFILSEKYEVSAKDLFVLSSMIMSYATEVIEARERKKVPEGNAAYLS